MVNLTQYDICIMRASMKNHTWHVARFTDKNMTQLLELRKLQYMNTEFVRQEYVRWQLEENPAGRAISWIALDRESKVLGEYWIVPAKFKINKDFYLGSIGANALVHLEYRRKKIFTVLGKKCSDNCIKRSIKFTLYIPNKLSLKGLVRKLDCKDLGEIPFLIHPLHINKLAEYKFQGKLAQRLAAGVMKKIYRRPMCTKNYKINNMLIELVNVSSFGQDFDSLWNRIKDKYLCITVRDSVFMNWRYVRMPVRKYNIFLAKGENRILGYLISRSATILGLESGFIMDFLFESSALGWAAGHSLLDMILEKFKVEEAHLVCCLSPSHTEEYRLLKNHGFFVCLGLFKPHLFHLVAQIHNNNLEGKYLDDLNCWHWSLGDYDVL